MKLRDAVTAFIFTMIVCIFLNSMLTKISGKPERPSPKKAEPKKIEPLAIVGETNWGTLTQSGKSIAFNGDSNWDGIGEIRADGKIQIIWTLKSTGEPCPGVYAARESDGALVGKWGFARNGVHIAENGILQAGENGYLRDDVTHRVEAK